MSNDREMLLDAPDEQPEQAVAPLTDEPEVDTGYDPGNPWWAFCREYERLQKEEQDKRDAEWAAMTPEDREAERQRCAAIVAQIKEQIELAKDIQPSAVEAETNRLILRALEKERIDREARAAGVESPCSLKVDHTHRTEE